MLCKKRRKGTAVMACLAVSLLLYACCTIISFAVKTSSTSAVVPLLARMPTTRLPPHLQYATIEDVPLSDLPPHVRCAAIIHNDTAAIEAAKQVDSPTSPELHHDSMSNCTTYLTQRRFLQYSVSREEEEFPIAFSIIVYAEWTRAERLLRAIYRPHNVYCLHIDEKAPQTVYRSLAAVARCLSDNVLLPSERVNVSWGQYSVLEAEIVCLRALLASGRPFKYFINLTGQEFPLKTNLELVRILKIFNGSDDIQCSPLEGQLLSRVTHVYRNGRMTSERKSLPPHNITLMKGQVHVVMSRKFVDYVIKSNVSAEFLFWLRDTYVPDETFFASLSHHYQQSTSSMFRGASTRCSLGQQQSISRFKAWINEGYECRGKYVRGICIIGVGDLPVLAISTQLFVNKLHYNYQPLAYDCLEQLHYNRTREDIMNSLRQRIDLDFYRSLNLF